MSDSQLDTPGTTSRKRLFNDAFPASQSSAFHAPSQYIVNFPAKFEKLLQEVAFQQDDLLESAKRNKSRATVFVAKQLISDKKFSKIALGKLVRNYSLPLEFLWMLQCAEILHFSLYVPAQSDESLRSLGNRLATFLSQSQDNPQFSSISGISIDLMTSCIMLVHGPDPPPNLNPVRKACRTLLTHALKECHFPLDENDNGIYLHNQMIFWLAALLR
ncbi:uncharacterized protein LOC132198054 [Neocloeon triangulifer]|uniref:uncharacterized protein LOC132198054 n=1 Tax=Neocloeon triangulifer TaxID=2078957 RepID=UPI00286EDBC4|nr:uncharacterized protein LOC132198054 [Neocloeon triangulifer]